MALKCQARIVREYKTRKAEVCWPETVYGATPEELLAKYPEACGGDVTVKVKAVDEPYFGGASAKLEVEWTCSRCREPYVPGRFEVDGAAAGGWLDITNMVELVKQVEGA